MTTKIIIIRGNSGSGKSTIAKKLRNEISDGLSDNTMLVQQDTFRREILRERDLPDRKAVIELMGMVVEFGRKQNRVVIVEGIFGKAKYGDMLRKMVESFDESYAYYFDLPIEETLVRHATKLNSHEFGEEEMREWFKEKDFLGLPGEKILDETMGVEEVVEQIINDIGH